MKKLVTITCGVAMALALASCSDAPRDYDAEPVDQVEEGQVPECFHLYDETNTDDDEGDPIGTYCRQG